MHEIRRYITVVESAEQASMMETTSQTRWYHISSNKDLKIKDNHKHRQAQMGSGFYITRDPLVWRDTLYGENDDVYLYRVHNVDNDRIATDIPSFTHQDFLSWALDEDYLTKELVMRNGEIMRYIDSGEPMVDYVPTNKAKPFMTKDPMTGNSTNGLINLYLKHKGFIGAKPPYSRDGEQVLIFDTTPLRLENLGLVDDNEEELSNT